VNSLLYDSSFFYKERAVLLCTAIHVLLAWNYYAPHYIAFVIMHNKL